MNFSPETLNTFRILATILYGLFAGSVASSILFPQRSSVGSPSGLWKDRHEATARVFHFAFGGAIVPMAILIYGALGAANALHYAYQCFLSKGKTTTPQAPAP